MNKPPIILLFGKNGQVGWELQRSLAPLGQLVALDSSSRDYCGDFTNLKGIAATVAAIKPDVIVNAAAYTAVDKAESEPNLALQINADAPGVIAEAAQKIDALMVHYSTDYVFDGTGQKPWLENDQPAPLNVYGKTKLQGEQLVAQNCARHLIFRTSWVFAARGANFAKTILRFATERDALNVIDDQIGSPTGADLIADVTAHAINHFGNYPQTAGIYNLVAAGETSWHGYAQFVVEQAALAGAQLKTAPENVHPINTSAYPTPAKRPHNSRLDIEKLQATFDLHLPPWHIGVSRMLNEIV